MKNIIFWGITLCSPLKVNRHFGGTYRFHLQGVIATCFHPGILFGFLLDHEGGGDMFLRNVG
jgi:hypothetical protein